MKRSIIVAIIMGVVLLYSGMAIADYAHLYSPVFKIDIVKITSFFVDSQHALNNIVAPKVPAPLSEQIDQSMRLQETVARSV